MGARTIPQMSTQMTIQLTIQLHFENERTQF